jgi:hypothetical protein
VSIPDVLGVIGSITIAITYFANLQGMVTTEGWFYSLLNFWRLAYPSFAVLGVESPGRGDGRLLGTDQRVWFGSRVR